MLIYIKIDLFLSLHRGHHWWYSLSAKQPSINLTVQAETLPTLIADKHINFISTYRGAFSGFVFFLS